MTIILDEISYFLTDLFISSNSLQLFNSQRYQMVRLYLICLDDMFSFILDTNTLIGPILLQLITHLLQNHI